MVRTQIQLTEAQSVTIRNLALERNVSVAEIIRISVDQFVAREAGAGREGAVARARSAAGRFASGKADISEDHDRYLAGAIEGR